jgi:hypothetical protein
VSATDTITLLGWLCYAAGAFALLVYVVHFAGRQGWKRPWNAAGLFFTAIALAQVPPLFRHSTDNSELFAAIVVTLCLVIATGLQAMTALRKRRRADDAAAAEASAP